MKNILYSAFFCLLLASNMQTQIHAGSYISAQQDKLIVTGKVINRTKESPKVITVIECSPLDDGGRYASQLDSNEMFRTEMSFVYEHSFTINYADKFINLYGANGDSLYLEIDAKKLSENKESPILFGGDKAAGNNYFSEVIDKTFPLINNVELAPASVPLKDYMETFQSEYTRLKDSIRVYSQPYSLQENVLRMLDHMALFSLANMATDYTEKNPQDALAFFTQPVFDLYNTENLKVMMFPYHLDYYRQALLDSDSIAKACLEKEDIKALYHRGTELLLTLPEGTYRDIMLAGFCNRLKRFNLEILPPRESFCNDTVFQYVSRLSAAAGTTKKQLPEMPLTDGIFYYASNGKAELVPVKNLTDFLKEKYKGKVVYLDIWATWCGPCRAEMKHAKALHTSFKDRDIVFVNICMMSDRAKWEKAIRDENIGGENYFLNEDMSQICMSALQVPGFPTYLLLDKTGAIINRTPPRPSALPKLQKELESVTSVVTVR